MKKTISLLFLFVTAMIAIAQPTATPIAANNIPKQVKYQGTAIDGLQWNDADGKHVVVRTETGILDNKTGTRNAELYGYHYILQDDSARLVWRLNDFVRDCELDVTANFMNVFTITDVDKDKQPELWVLYQTSCKGDVSPNTMKLIMYEGNEKHAMRGRRKIKINESETEGGEYEFDNAFKAAPAALRQYAEKLWKTHMLEK